MRRVVLDLNVVVSGLITPNGICGVLLDRWLAGMEFDVVLCPRWLQELAGVTARRKFRRYRPEVAPFMALARKGGIVLGDPTDVLAVTEDPDDDYLVALARFAGCDAIISRDRHLLACEGPPPVLTPHEMLLRLTSDLDS